jgi:hypothetical protein
LYNKIFTKILDSSIWLESDATRLIWLTMLASMDQDGFCQFASIGNLAHRAIVSRELAEAAVKVLESPDKDSSDPDHEGRRIERVDGGWMVLNSSKYRDIVTAEESRRKTRERVQRLRLKRKVTTCNDSVTPANVPVMQSEAYAEANTKAKRTTSSRRSTPGDPDSRQVAVATGESRHTRSQQLVMGWYQEWAGLECPWDGGEAKQLSSLLKAWPRVSDVQFVQCLDNIAKSECIPKGDRPREWLGKMPKFVNGPLDQFWKTKNLNGNGGSNGKTKLQRNLEAAQRLGEIGSESHVRQNSFGIPKSGV